MNDNICVCCGVQIPEGRMICTICENKELLNKNNKLENKVIKLKEHLNSFYGYKMEDKTYEKK